MVFVVIRLVGEAEDRLFENIILEPQISRVDLVKEIESVTNIPPKFQQVQYRGDKLPDSLHPLESINDFEELVVKHSMANNWTAFFTLFEAARQALATKQIKDVERNVDLAIQQLKPLVEAKFLVTFPNFVEPYRQFTANFSRYMDQEYRYIEFAVHDYFSKIFLDDAELPTLDIKCEKKSPDESGIQASFNINYNCIIFICNVLRNGSLLGKYYVKEHIGLSNWQHADLREIFIYKLFELIQVGPEVHFIPNTHYSGLGLYIGTKEVVGFRRADTEGLEISNELYAQRDLLRRVLCVKDLHSKNYGVDDKGKLSIVDFQINGSVDSAAVLKYLDGYKGWKGSKELRIQTAKDYIKSWNLLNAFERANAAIVKQKELFKKHCITYKPSRNFDEYLCLIKNNLNVLVERLG